MHTEHVPARARPQPPGTRASRWRRRVAVVVAAVIALTGAIATAMTPAAPVTAAVAPTAAPNGFVVFNDDSGNLWTLDARYPSKKVLTNLTLAGAGKGVNPQVSPDGNKIAFEWQGDIYTANIDATGRRQLTDDVLAHAPTWSPDGTQIAYAVDDDLSGQWFIHTMKPDGTNDSTLYTEVFDPDTPLHPYELADVSHLTWSPDGTKIAARGAMNPKFANIWEYAGEFGWNAAFPQRNDHAHSSSAYSSRTHRPLGFLAAWPSAYANYGESCFLAVGKSQIVGWPVGASGCPVPAVRDSGIVLFNADGSGQSFYHDALEVGRPTWKPDSSTLVWSDRGTAAHTDSAYPGTDLEIPNVVLTPNPGERTMRSTSGTIVPVGATDPVYTPDHGWLAYTVEDGTVIQFRTVNNSQTVNIELGFAARNLDIGRFPSFPSLAVDSGFESEWARTDNGSSFTPWRKLTVTTQFVPGSGSPYLQGWTYAQVNTSTAGGGIYQDIPVSVPAGQHVCVHAKVRASQSSMTGSLRLATGGAITDQPFTATSSWTSQDACVQSSGAATNIRVEIKPDANGKTLHVDDVDVVFSHGFQANGGFEDGTSGWAKNGWSTSFNVLDFPGPSGDARTGAQYATVQTPTADGAIWQEHTVNVRPGRRYCAWAYLRAHYLWPAATGRLLVSFTEPAGTDNGGTVFTVGSSWTVRSACAWATSAHTKVYVLISPDEAYLPHNTVDIDDVSIVVS